MFLYPFLKSTNKEQWISHALTSINQEFFLDQSQFISLVFLSIILSIFLLCLCIFRNPAVFDFITCVSFCK